MIHSTAVIDKQAQIASSAQIGPYCVIGPHVVLGDNVKLHSHVVIDGHTHIDEGTEIYPFASLGTAPQDLKFGGEESFLKIGQRNRIREHVTMNPGTKGGGMETVVGDDGLFMVGVHIAHDCRVGDRVVMANNATLAGHVTVGDNAIIGGLSAVRQFIRIGAFAMIGGMSGVEADVIPFGLVKGERAFLDGLNLIGLERNGFTKDQVKTLQRAYNDLFSDSGTLEQRLEQIEQNYDGSELVLAVARFAREKTKFPLCQPSSRKAA